MPTLDDIAKAYYDAEMNKAQGEKGLADYLMHSWPVHMMQSALTAGHDAAVGNLGRPGSREFTENSIPRALDMAGVASVGSMPSVIARGAEKGALGIGVPVKMGSKLEDVIAKGQGKATPEQWFNTIKNAGVKKEEIEATGLEEFLRGHEGPVSKQDLMQHVQDQRTPVHEVEKTGEKVTRDEHSLPDDDPEFIAHQAAGREPWFDWRPHPRGGFGVYRVYGGLDTLGEHPFVPERRAELLDRVGDEGAAEDMAYDLAHNHYHNWAQKQDPQADRVRYPSYTLPGGENYREMLLTGDAKSPPTPARVEKTSWGWQIYAGNDRLGGVRNPPGRPITEEEAMAIAQQSVNKLAETRDKVGANPVYRSGHWAEPNVIAHMRYNDRFIPDESGPSLHPDLMKDKEYWDKEYADGKIGKEQYEAGLKNQDDAVKERGLKGHKTLFLEELQSDWHQAGQKYGYRGEGPKGDWHAEDMAGSSEGSPTQSAVKDPYGRVVLYTTKEATEQPGFWDYIKQTYGNSPSPQPPHGAFEKSWTDLAAKRMIQKAVDEGYDAIGWTKGDTQAERWMHSGKEAEGIKYFYDTHLKKAFEKHGNKVEDRSMEIVPTQKEIDQGGGKLDTEPEHDIHFMPIDEALRTKVKEKGFPLYQSGAPASAPEQKPQQSLPEQAGIGSLNEMINNADLRS